MNTLVQRFGLLLIAEVPMKNSANNGENEFSAYKYLYLILFSRPTFKYYLMQLMQE